MVETQMFPVIDHSQAKVENEEVSVFVSHLILAWFGVVGVEEKGTR
jgi:hypothetical protein